MGGTLKFTLEKIVLMVNESYRYFEHNRTHFHVPMHYHPEFEIVQIVHGNGYRLVGDHYGEFVPDDLVLFGANLPHAWFSYQTEPRFDSAAYSHVLHYDGAAMLRHLRRYPNMRA
jgi:cupin superfamily acireductone dioxygenase involved in methionine salvage